MPKMPIAASDSAAMANPPSSVAQWRCGATDVVDTVLELARVIEREPRIDAAQHARVRDRRSRQLPGVVRTNRLNVRRPVLRGRDVHRLAVAVEPLILHVAHDTDDGERRTRRAAAALQLTTDAQADRPSNVAPMRDSRSSPGRRCQYPSSVNIAAFEQRDAGRREERRRSPTRTASPVAHRRAEQGGRRDRSC